MNTLIIASYGLLNNVPTLTILLAVVGAATLVVSLIWFLERITAWHTGYRNEANLDALYESLRSQSRADIEEMTHRISELKERLQSKIKEVAAQRLRPRLQ